MQEETPSPSSREDNPTEIAQVIDEGEYMTLVERLQALRQGACCPLQLCFRDF